MGGARIQNWVGVLVTNQRLHVLATHPWNSKQKILFVKLVLPWKNKKKQWDSMGGFAVLAAVINLIAKQFCQKPTSDWKHTLRLLRSWREGTSVCYWRLCGQPGRQQAKRYDKFMPGKTAHIQASSTLFSWLLCLVNKLWQLHVINLCAKQK